MHLIQSLTLLAAISSLASAAPAQLPFSAPASQSNLLPSLSSLNLEPLQLAAFEAHVASLPEKRIVRLGEGADQVAEITEGEKALLTYLGRKFMDVTDDEEFLRTNVEKEVYPSALTYNASQLKPLFKHISTSSMKTFLTKFSGFRTRYYRSETGKESQKFLLATLKDIAKTNKEMNVSFSEFPHPWGQNSIIVRFEPEATKEKKSAKKEGKWRMSKTSEKIVILSAHQDSTNMLPFLGAPGADDDGSGTTTLVEAFKALVNATFVPSTNPVEFHFYSAEEGGLLGSNAVAQEYAKQGKVIRSQLQMDMTAWVKAGTTESIGIITDFVDPDLTAFMRKLVEGYATIPWIDTQCGYACSDHASWSKVGAPSAFSIESTFADSNHNIHSSNDRIDYSPEFSFDHMAQFVRLSIGMAVELGGGASLNLD